MLLDFGREVCGNLALAKKREWLVTNGIGGFASGTIANILTRRYHGLLMAALRPPLGRTLLLAKLDETAEYDGIRAQSGHYYPLYDNHWSNGGSLVEPNGHYYLNRFHLEGTTPVWTFACANALLEKRVWMQHGANTTYIQYRLTRASGPLLLQAKAFVNYRDYHSTTIINEWLPEIVPIERGLRLRIFDAAAPFYIYSDRAEITPQFDWYEGFLLDQEEYRGQNDVEEDHIYAAHLRAVLQPGESLTVVATTEPGTILNGDEAYSERQEYEASLLEKAGTIHPQPLSSPLRQLILAADQFIVKRTTTQNPYGHSIIAGYHWFSDWGRDTMIALPGLTLSTGRPDVAATILKTYSQFVDQGMLPNRFPDAGEEPEYNTVDATLWYFEAVHHYIAATSDNALLNDIFPILADIIEWHLRGTRFNIHVDPQDGLLYAGQEGIQLTWMDAKADDWVVTPRIGKPVEINALWFNALRIMADFAAILGGDSEYYSALAETAKNGFTHFWNSDIGYCYDVIDMPDGTNDLCLRPNQLFAVSLPNSPLNTEQQKSVVDSCARLLLTAHGLRSLSPQDVQYKGHYGGDQVKRDGSYHQGTVWSWLIGPFVAAHLRVYQDLHQARTFVLPLIHHLADHGVGSISEIFDGNPPFTPRGCIAQAWGVAELLRIWKMTERPN
ncbi:MAG: amylo-alpha-1,6-glucosidase [Candidatus Promineifilaceae bacterium]|nr:amylo-alpha-1,6-glucosidase [Candidatus Promineifilaceae bacterium]